MKAPLLSGGEPPCGLPSHAFECVDGVWRSNVSGEVSYPADGNEACLRVEDSSYWFAHRNRCITAVTGLFPPLGAIIDVGGGNGCVSAALRRAGHDVVLVEPGSGAGHAVRRGLPAVIQARFEDVGFPPGSVAAIGAFDVVEHIQDDLAFLRMVRQALKPGGVFYSTVPAHSLLWSEADEIAGHFRRYSRSTLSSVLRAAGMRTEYLTYFFSWLTAPLFTLRTLPYACGRRDSRQAHSARIDQEHALPAMLSGIVGRIHEWELKRIARRRPIRVGTSLLCVARRIDE